MTLACACQTPSEQASTDAAPAAQPFETGFKRAYAEFDYSWPAEVSAIPELAARFRADMEEQKAELISGGQEFAEMREEMGLGELGYAHSTEIKTAGQTPRLLSLAIHVYEFTGGAHGLGGTSGLLWDRAAGTEIGLADLVVPAAGTLDSLRTTYCTGLERERIERRGGDGTLGGGIPKFDSCPSFADLAFIPGDADRDGRFEALRFVASPYLAGPYAEGEYDIAVPVTSELIAALKPAYRSSFEAQPQ